MMTLALDKDKQHSKITTHLVPPPYSRHHDESHAKIVQQSWKDTS